MTELQHSIESAAFMFTTKRRIGPEEDPYLIRWIIAQTPWFSVYVHKLCRSDYERATHDHPWNFHSFILFPYSEVYDIPIGGEFGNSDDQDDIIQTEFITHKIFSLIYRPATWRHRVVIANKKKPGWTVVFTGPRIRKWGFWPLDKTTGLWSWCHWKKFNQDLGICESEPMAGKTGLD